ncbi:MAG: methylated-DNA--[protein]-cysteine S-methyltransferase [Kiritimatiellales bacterium]
MKTANLSTTWGTLTLTLDDRGRAAELQLPHLDTAPRKPFKGKISNHWKTAADFFQTLEKTFPIIGNPPGTEFQQAVWKAMKKIPRGQTRTYGELAAAIGRPNAVRAVGSACGANPLPVFIPCHRVTAKNGLGGFGSGLPWKTLLLQTEGVL